MSLPSILISVSEDDRGAYENAVVHAGGHPTAAYCPKVDLSYAGLILSGGDDVDPARYGQENHGSQGIDPARDQAEFALVAAFLAAGKPIFGICRGHQVLNIALGGSLIQDITAHQCDIHTYVSGAAQDKVHPVRTAEDSLLRRFYGPLAAVNSAHHQAVDRLGDGLIPTAWSESGLIEAVEHTHLPVLGVQFHPERMAYARRRPDAADGSFLFEWFLRLCNGEA